MLIVMPRMLAQSFAIVATLLARGEDGEAREVENGTSSASNEPHAPLECAPAARTAEVLPQGLADDQLIERQLLQLGRAVDFNVFGVVLPTPPCDAVPHGEVGLGFIGHGLSLPHQRLM